MMKERSFSKIIAIYKFLAPCFCNYNYKDFINITTSHFPEDPISEEPTENPIPVPMIPRSEEIADAAQPTPLISSSNDVPADELPVQNPTSAPSDIKTD